MEVSCDMRNVIYSCTDSGYLMWSASETENEGIEWREIKGLKTGKIFFCFKALKKWDGTVEESAEEELMDAMAQAYQLGCLSVHIGVALTKE
ncbi:unnamed protein product [Brassica oleracea var. botrytis]